jgi:hypothetical protein
VQVFEIGNVETPEDGVRLLHVGLKACIVSCFNEVVGQHVDRLRTPVLDPNFRSLPCLLEMKLMWGGEKSAMWVERDMEVMKGGEKGKGPTRIGREVRVQAVKSEADDDSEYGKSRVEETNDSEDGNEQS